MRRGENVHVHAVEGGRVQEMGGDVCPGKRKERRWQETGECALAGLPCPSNVK